MKTNETLVRPQTGIIDKEPIKDNESTWKASRQALNGSRSMSYYSYERKELDRQLYDDGESSMADDETSNEKTRLLPRKRTLRWRIEEPSKWRSIVMLAACMFIHFNSFGLIAAFGVTYVELIRVFDAPRSQAALVQSVYTGMTLGGGVLFSTVITKYGVGACVMASSVTGSAALLVSSYAHNVPVIVVLVGVVAGASMSVHVLSGFVAVSWTFSANRKLALSILTFGPTVGQIAFPYITELLLNEFNWNGTFFIISAFMLNSIPCGLILFLSKDYMKHKPTGDRKQNVIDMSCCKDVTYMLLLVAAFLYGSTGPVEQWFVVDLAVLNGLPRVQGTVIISLVGLFGLGGRIIGTVLLRLFPSISMMVHLFCGFLVWAVAHVLVVSFRSFVGMAVAVAIRGLSAGLVIALVPGLHLEVRGLERYPQTAALCNFISGVGQIIGGLAGGSTVDITGNYDLIFYIAGGSSAICGMLMAVMYCLRPKLKPHVERSQSTIVHETITRD